MASQHSSPTTSEQIETNSSTTSSKRTAAVTKRRFSLTQQVIGKGSFATVFLGYEDPPVSVANRPMAEDENERKVAIKYIDKAKMTRHVKQTLQQEITLLRSIHAQTPHPHIINLLSLRETPSSIQIITEYCDLGDLHSYIRRSRVRNDLGGVHPVLIHHVLKGISSALKTLRDMNLVHRDLKPHNVLLMSPPKKSVEPDENRDMSVVLDGSPWKSVNELPVVKLGDFGFARVLEAQDLAETLCGSPLYMAPEILSYEKYDAKADLWSVGTVLYEMMTAKTPYKAQNPLDLLRKIKQSTSVTFPDEVTEMSAPASTTAVSGSPRATATTVRGESIPKNAAGGDGERQLPQTYTASSPISIPSSMTPGTGGSYVPKGMLRRRAGTMNSVAYSTDSTQNPHPQQQISSISTTPLRRSTSSLFNQNSNLVISGELKELARNLLRKDPMERMSFDEFFAHPCVSQGVEFLFNALNIGLEKIDEVSAGMIETRLSTLQLGGGNTARSSLSSACTSLPIQQPFMHSLSPSPLSALPLSPIRPFAEDEPVQRRGLVRSRSNSGSNFDMEEGRLGASRSPSSRLLQEAMDENIMPFAMELDEGAGTPLSNSRRNSRRKSSRQSSPLVTQFSAPSDSEDERNVASFVSSRSSVGMSGISSGGLVGSSSALAISGGTGDEDKENMSSRRKSVSSKLRMTPMEPIPATTSHASSNTMVTPGKFSNTPPMYASPPITNLMSPVIKPNHRLPQQHPLEEVTGNWVSWLGNVVKGGVQYVGHGTGMDKLYGAGITSPGALIQRSREQWEYADVDDASEHEDDGFVVI